MEILTSRTHHVRAPCERQVGHRPTCSRYLLSAEISNRLFSQPTLARSKYKKLLFEFSRELYILLISTERTLQTILFPPFLNCKELVDTLSYFDLKVKSLHSEITKTPYLKRFCPFHGLHKGFLILMSFYCQQHIGIVSDQKIESPTFVNPCLPDVVFFAILLGMKRSMI